MDPAPSSPDPSGTTPLDVVRLLRAGGGALVLQLLLHGQLAQIEWREEKERLLRMLAVSLLGFACLLGVMLFAGSFVVLVFWDTPYRLAAAGGIVLLSAAGLVVAWRHFRTLAALGGQAFAGVRAELAADVALLRSNL